MDDLVRDLSHALRQLRRQPGFAAVAVVTLALGIGAATSIFSVMSAVLLEPLPYEAPDRVVAVWNTFDEGKLDLSEQELATYRAEAKSLAGVRAFLFGDVNLTDEGRPDRVRAAAVEPGLLEILGVQPALGRDFAPEDGVEGAAGVAMLSHGLWLRRFGADPGVVGRSVRVDGEAATVVGVLPEDFTMPLDFTDPTVEILVPLALPPSPDPRNLHYLSAVGRVAPGATLGGARSELALGARRMKERLGDRLPDPFSATAVPLSEELSGPVRSQLFMLFGAVGILVLVASANVTNLQLARGHARRRELAIRSSLGAGRGRLVRQLLVESTTLSVAGGVLGVGLAAWGTRALLQLVPSGLPRADAVGMDLRVLGFALGISLLVGIVSGLAPALRLSERGPGEALRQEGGRAGSLGGRRGHRFLRGLVVAEIALTVVLSVGSGLLLRSLVNLNAESSGLAHERALTFGVEPPAAAYPGKEETNRFFRELRDSLAALPGVRAVGASTQLPLASDPPDWGVRIRGRGPDGLGEKGPAPDWHATVPGWFEAMGIPVLEGRTLEDRDVADGRPVVVVSAEMARRHWPGASPVGGRIRLTTDVDTVWRTVVGVVGDVHYRSLDREPEPVMYLPQGQFPATADFVVRTLFVSVATDGDPSGVAALVRRTVAGVDPGVPLTDLRPFSEVRASSTAGRRFQMVVLTIFAALALVLVVGGVYGVTAYVVSRRRGEMGLRMALGATPAGVTRLVLGDGARTAAMGLGAGVLGAAALVGIVRSRLYGVEPLDPVTFVAVCALLGLVTIGATWVPARAAASVDPMRVLERE